LVIKPSFVAPEDRDAVTAMLTAHGVPVSVGMTEVIRCRRR
jgi:hypothetical protein